MSTRFFRRAAAICVTASLLASCSTYVDHRVDAALLDALPKVLGPAARYEVDVQGSTLGASHFDVVHVRGYRIQRESSPVIDAMTIDLQDVDIDRAAKTFTSIGQAVGSVTVTASDLDAYLSQHPRFASVTVAFQAPDAVAMVGNLKVPGTASDALQVRFDGRLVPSGSRLNLAIGDIQAGSLRALPVVRGVLESIVNPLFDLSAYAVPATIDRIVSEPGTLTIHVSGSSLVPGTRGAR